jgi:hypothetical protein
MGPNVLYVVFYIRVCFPQHSCHGHLRGITTQPNHNHEKTKPTKNEVTISTNIFDGKTQIAD